MKKIKLFISFLSLGFITSCTNDGGTSLQKITIGAVPNIIKSADSDVGINLVAINNGLDFNIGMTINKEDGDVQSMDVVGFYSKKGVVEKAYLKKGLTTFPTTISLNKAALLTAFSSLNTNADFQSGDALTVSAEITLTNGTITKVFKDNGEPSYGSSLLSIYKNMFQKFDIVCPLVDASNFNGNYKVIADGWVDYTLGTIIPVVYSATNGLLEFRIPNATRPGIINSGTSYLKVVINPADFSVVVTSNENWIYPDPTPATPFITTVTGDGTVNACNFDIELLLDFSGSSQNAPFKLVKI